MRIAYEDVLDRLKEERHRLLLSQKEMGRLVRMNQSNFSKVELGLRRLNYYELKYLCDSEVDVHYIYTGRRSSGQYADFFSQCSYVELICFLSIVYSVVLLRYRDERAEKWKNILEKIKYVPLIEENPNASNIFLVIRRSANCQQLKMAEILGVDVKKLRDLENGRTLPDSELLCRLYELYRIPPAAILKDKRGMESEISIFLDMLDTADRNVIFDIIKAVHNMN